MFEHHGRGRGVGEVREECRTSIFTLSVETHKCAHGIRFRGPSLPLEHAEAEHRVLALPFPVRGIPNVNLKKSKVI
jgi:hypothetical protein